LKNRGVKTNKSSRAATTAAIRISLRQPGCFPAFPYLSFAPRLAAIAVSAFISTFPSEI
jgi:hypothetical protein